MNRQASTPAWVELTQSEGEALAHLMVQQLTEIGIAAYKWQEGAGGAFGLTVGPLGITHVMVPEDRYDEAREHLALDDPDAIFEPVGEWAAGWDDEEASETDDLFSRISRAMLAIAAVVLSPLGVVVTYLMKYLPESKSSTEDDFDSAETPALDDA